MRFSTLVAAAVGLACVVGLGALVLGIRDAGRAPRSLGEPIVVSATASPGNPTPSATPQPSHTPRCDDRDDADDRDDRRDDDDGACAVSPREPSPAGDDDRDDRRDDSDGDGREDHDDFDGGDDSDASDDG